MTKNVEILNNDDVISVFKHDEGRFASGDTLKVQQLLTEYQGYIEAQTKTINNHEIFEGIECEVLRQNSEHKSWCKGKIKLVVQFEPETINDNNSTLLDDIRHQLDTKKQRVNNYGRDKQID